MLIRLWDEDNKCLEIVDFSNLEKALEIIDSYRDYFHKDYFKDNPSYAQAFSKIEDKKGVRIFEGDILRIRKAYRTTQTHTGNNIPLGSYTEPMEPGIEEIIGKVVLSDGVFGLVSSESDDVMSLSWELIAWDKQAVKDALNWNYNDSPEDGDIAYLKDEIVKCKTDEELFDYLGLEVIGNIFQNPELVNDDE